MSNITGIVHPKMKIVSSFTLPQVVPNLYTFLSSVEHKGRYFEECGKLNSSRTLFLYYESQRCLKAAWLQTSKHLPLCSVELRNVYRFGTTCE